MSMPMPEGGGIAVDPNEVTRVLRQRHAEMVDGLTYENATLRAALNDAQATISETRIKNEELAAALAQAQQELAALRAMTKPAGTQNAVKART